MREDIKRLAETVLEKVLNTDPGSAFFAATEMFQIVQRVDEEEAKALVQAATLFHEITDEDTEEAVFAQLRAAAEQRLNELSGKTNTLTT